MIVVELTVVVVLVYVVFFFLRLKLHKDDNMISPYECGFDSIMESRVGFSYRFFLISILFLVFDVEISLILPVPYIGRSSCLIIGVMFFVLVLLGGLVYEYYNGVLSWL